MPAKKKSLTPLAALISELIATLPGRQGEAAKLLGVRQSTVSRWATGPTRPGRQTILALANLAEGYLREALLREASPRGTSAVITIPAPSHAEDFSDRELLTLMLSTVYEELAKTGEEISGEEFAERILRYYDGCHKKGYRTRAKVLTMMRSA